MEKIFTQLAAEDIYAGGTAFLAAHTFAAGIGPVQESRDELYEYKGKNGKIQEYNSLMEYGNKQDKNTPEGVFQLSDTSLLPSEQHSIMCYLTPIK